MRRADPVRHACAVAALLLPSRQTQLLGVYSRKNAANISSLVAQAKDLKVPALLWALDHPATELEDWTIGQGAGTRFENFNRLLTHARTDSWTILVDDDVRLRRGSLRAFVRLAQWARLDISQPGHDSGSYASHPIVKRSFGTIYRVTTFVEIGPMVMFSPSVLPQVSPFPTEGFGWGIEMLWSDLRRAGVRLGIVDCAPMRHLQPAASRYGRGEEDARQSEMFADRGVQGWSDLQHTIESVGLFGRRRTQSGVD